MIALTKYLFLFVLVIITNGSSLPPSGLSEEIQDAYERKDTARLRKALQAASTPSEKFLAIYRLYPLTLDKSLIRNIPTELKQGSAREYALLAALWSYRINEDKSMLISAGMRINGLLDKAKRLNPNEPVYLLVDGQGLFYMPGVFGGSYNKALVRFRAARDVIVREKPAGLSRLDAETWIWYALHKQKAANAQAYKQELLGRGLPQIYREFLLSPP